MIPLSNISNYEIITYPTRTYFWDRNSNRIMGVVDGIEAMQQAIYKALNTERFDYVIYSHNYGITLKDLFGKDRYIACAVLERRIRDTLLVDDRITDVSDFEFKVYRHSVLVKFNVTTTIGQITEEVELNV